MFKAMAIVVLMAGCVAEETAMDQQDIRGDTDGWGEWCDNPPAPANATQLWNDCYSENGVKGRCDDGVCRRYCTNTLGGCPRHFRAVFVVGDDCICEPNLRPWDSSAMAPANDQVRSPHYGP